MKKLLFLFALLLSINLTAQSRFTMEQLVKGSPEVSVQEASAHNAWLGAKGTGTFGSGDLADHFLLSGKIIYDLPIGKFKLPIISNVNFNFENPDGDFVFGDKGLSIGVYPYTILSQEGKTTVVLHGGLAYKLLPQETFKITPQQTRLFAGIEVAYAGNDARYPLTISVTPLYTINNLDNSNMFAIEVTGVLPLTGGLGLLGELTSPFKKGVDSIFKIGLVTSINL